MRFCHREIIGCRAAIALALTFAGAPVFAAGLQYQGELDPVALDNSTVINTMGKGNVTGIVSGRALVISGDYVGLSSSATAAHVEMGSAPGVPGPVIGDLQVSGGVSGQITGELSLTLAQLAALKRGGLSVVVDSVKAPDGNLWGWLLASSESE